MKIEKQIREYYSALAVPAMEAVLPECALEQKKKTTAYWKIAALAGGLCVLLLLSVLLLPGMRTPDGPPHISDRPTEGTVTKPTTGNPTEPTRPTDPVVPPTSPPAPTSPTAPTNPTDPNSGGTPMEPNFAYVVGLRPCTIIEIKEITTETKQLYNSDVGWYTWYTKVQCVVLYTHNNHCDDKWTEIYVPSSSVEKLRPYSRIITKIEYVDSKVSTDSSIPAERYYGPDLDKDGKPVFMPFVDDALVYEPTNGFLGDFSIINTEIDYIEKRQEKGQELSAAQKAYPKQKFASGMTVQEVIAFFEAYDEAADLYIKDLSKYDDIGIPVW